jgi:hypothetical protein
MTDLATRIADVKKEIEADRITYVSRSLFLAMAARIEELQAKADDWKIMKDELDMAKFGYQAIKEDTDSEIAGLRKRNEELEKALAPFAEAESKRAAKGVWLKKRGTITTKDTLEDVIDDTIVLDRALLRTAALDALLASSFRYVGPDEVVVKRFVSPHGCHWYGDIEGANDLEVALFFARAKDASDFCDWMTAYDTDYRAMIAELKATTIPVSQEASDPA